MLFLPVSILLFIIFILILPLLIFILGIGLIQTAFLRLGISPFMTGLILTASLLGSLINIPIKREVHIERVWFGLFPPAVEETVICLNFGGAVVPALVSIYLLNRAPLIPVIISTILMALVAKKFTRVVPRVGFAIPALIPPITAAILAYLFSPHNPAPVAYISGTMGTLIGADLLNLHKIKYLKSSVVSVGGAGIFDGVFLAGVISVLLV